MRFAFSSLIALATAALVVAQTPTPTKLQINPDPSVVHPIDKQPAQPQTNGKRFALGLPPLSPRHRVHRRDRQGGSYPGGGRGGDDNDNDDDNDGGKGPKGGYGHPVPSSRPPVTVKCNILVKDVNGTTFGFVSPVWNVFGEYGIVQQAQAGSLEVSFSFVPTKGTLPSQLNLLPTNGPSAAYPYVGATVGFVSPSDDLVVGGFNYAYITGTLLLPAGPPSEGDNNSFGGTTGIPKKAESAIWTYNPKTRAITPQWINRDGSKPSTFMVFANDFNEAFILTGDLAVFRDTFGAPYPQITFTCVPPQDA